MPTRRSHRPPGRPKTKEYATLQARVPRDVVDRVKTYADLHRQSISELIRDGLEWRLTDGDPHAQRLASPHREVLQEILPPNSAQDLGYDPNLIEPLDVHLARVAARKKRTRPTPRTRARTRQQKAPR